MAAETNARVTPHGGPYPVVGTYPIAANEEIIDGCFVALDSNKRAVDYSDDGNGYHIVGVARAGFDNRTTAPSGGAAEALSADVDFGVFSFGYSGTAPKPGQIVYGVDNQTVAISSTSVVSGYRGAAGVVTQVNTTAGTCRVYVSPLTAAIIDSTVDLTALTTEVGDYTGGGGAEADIATGLVQAETDITALEGDVGTYAGGADLSTDVAALKTDANTAAYEFGGNLLAGLRLSTGAAVAAFADGSADGYTLDDSEAVVLRLNNGSSTTFIQSVKIPDDVDDTAAVVLHVRGYRTGTEDVTTTLTVGAFAHNTGDVHTDDADAGGSTTAFDHATADTITEETLSFAAGVLPAGSNVSLTFTVDANLDADDLCLLDAWFVGTRVQHTS